MKEPTFNESLKILGVTVTASKDEITKSFRRLAMKFHPDRNPDPRAAEMFDTLKKARDTALKGEEIRSLHEPLGSMNGYVVTEIITITLEQAYNGCDISLRNGQRVRLAEGIRNDTKLVINGRSLLHIKIARHAIYKRKNDDILITVPISAIEAMVGTSITVKYLNGQNYIVTLPAGTQHGECIIITQLGCKHPVGNARGDFKLYADVIIPTKLSAAQNAALTQLFHVRPSISVPK